MIAKTHIHQSRFLLLTLLVAISTFGSAATLLAQDNEQNAPLTIYTAEAPPFVIIKPERLTGFSIDLWEEIALRTDIEYEWVVVNGFSDLQEAFESGDADAGISAIVMTSEREKVMDFTHPFFISGLRVMTIKEPIRPFRNVFSAVFSWDVLSLFAAFFVLILIVANIVWFFERHTNSHFPKGYFAGIWEAIWWASVTVTTVGYGDRVPLGKIGRIFGLFWMVAGLFLVANLTAGVTAHMTVQELQGQNQRLEDMANSTVVTIANSTVETFLTERGIKYITTTTLDEAHQLLLDGKAEGVVLDAHILSYYVQEQGNDDLEVIGETFEEEFYGIALPIDSPYRELINQTLLDIIDDGTFNELYRKWFGENVAW